MGKRRITVMIVAMVLFLGLTGFYVIVPKVYYSRQKTRFASYGDVKVLCDKKEIFVERIEMSKESFEKLRVSLINDGWDDDTNLMEYRYPDHMPYPGAFSEEEEQYVSFVFFRERFKWFFPRRDKKTELINAAVFGERVIIVYKLERQVWPLGYH